MHNSISLEAKILISLWYNYGELKWKNVARLYQPKIGRQSWVTIYIFRGLSRLNLNSPKIEGNVVRDARSTAGLTLAQTWTDL